MDKTKLTYDILDNGYVIKLEGKDWILQIDDDSKPMDSTKTFEENCLLQIEDLTKEVEEETPIEDRINAVETVVNTLLMTQF